MPRLIVIKGPLKNQVFDLDLNKGTVFCGRYPRMNDISIMDISVSRKHLKIFQIGENIFVEDLKSKHGTKINGKLIDPGEGFQIEEGDLITIGSTIMRLDNVSVKSPLSKKVVPLPPDKEDHLSKDRPKERRTKKELEFIYSASELFKKYININDFLREVLKFLLSALPRIHNAGFFLFRDGEIQVMEFIPRLREGSMEMYSRKVLKKVVRERKTVRMSNTSFESPDDYADSKEILKIGSIMCVPIVRDDEILGAIYIDSREPYSFRKGDQLLLNILTGPIGLAIEKDWMALNIKPDNGS